MLSENLILMHHVALIIIFFLIQRFLFTEQIKGLVHPKMKIMSVITHDVPTRKTFAPTKNYHFDYFNDVFTFLGRQMQLFVATV